MVILHQSSFDVPTEDRPSSISQQIMVVNLNRRESYSHLTRLSSHTLSPFSNRCRPTAVHGETIAPSSKLFPPTNRLIKGEARQGQSRPSEVHCQRRIAMKRCGAQSGFIFFRRWIERFELCSRRPGQQSQNIYLLTPGRREQQQQTHWTTTNGEYPVPRSSQPLPIIDMVTR